MEYPHLPSPSSIRRIIDDSIGLTEAPARQMVGAFFLCWGFCELLHIGLGASWATRSTVSTSAG
jgi:hypothetical protein